MHFYLGCPIWSFRGWVGNFYPEKTKPSEYLREYARRLTAIEGNTTFYAVPAEKTIEQWQAATPDSFRFCFKVPKAISHAGTLADRVDGAREFVRVMGQLGSRLGPMFLQLPPRYAPDMLDDLRAFLDGWPQGVRLGVEVRHLGWFDGAGNEALNNLLREYNMARVVIDTRPIRTLDGDEILQGSVYQALLSARRRKPNVPVLPERTADFLFVRYIGHPQLSVNAPLLDEWAGYLAAQLRQGADAFVICHSPENLTAPLLCRELHNRIARQVDIAPLPWDTANPGVAEQTRLM
ncbi:MAG TPA: DUF72 domain-containing protein [Anaerolineales bacterium]|nr:DUF72 domain-containing protein [Anaerolineales bacterium]